jgi:hypothetical protein
MGIVGVVKGHATVARPLYGFCTANVPYCTAAVRQCKWQSQELLEYLIPTQKLYEVLGRKLILLGGLETSTLLMS